MDVRHPRYHKDGNIVAVKERCIAAEMTPCCDAHQQPVAGIGYTAGKRAGPAEIFRFSSTSKRAPFCAVATEPAMMTSKSSVMAASLKK
jgi:hypothetical protein